MEGLIRVSVVHFVVLALGRHGDNARGAVPEPGLVVAVVVDHVVLFVARELVPLVRREIRLLVPRVPGAAGREVGAVGRHGAAGGRGREGVRGADRAPVHAVEALVLHNERRVRQVQLVFPSPRRPTAPVPQTRYNRHWPKRRVWHIRLVVVHPDHRIVYVPSAITAWFQKAGIPDSKKSFTWFQKAGIQKHYQKHYHQKIFREWKGVHDEVLVPEKGVFVEIGGGIEW
jgi:hypothetical protein